MQLIVTIDDLAVIQKILAHLGFRGAGESKTRFDLESPLWQDRREVRTILRAEDCGICLGASSGQPGRSDSDRDGPRR